jgi:hypothetical protein
MNSYVNAAIAYRSGVGVSTATDERMVADDAAHIPKGAVPIYDENRTSGIHEVKRGSQLAR